MSSALVKTSNSDTDAKYLYEKLLSSDATVTITEVLDGGVLKLDLQAPGGGAPVGIVFGLQKTAGNYTLTPATKTVVLITDSSHVVTLPAANTFQQAVMYVIKDGTGDAGANNLTINIDPADNFEGLDVGASLVLTDDWQCVAFFSDLINTFHFIKPSP